MGNENTTPKPPEIEADEVLRGFGAAVQETNNYYLSVLKIVGTSGLSLLLFLVIGLAILACYLKSRFGDMNQLRDRVEDHHREFATLSAAAAAKQQNAEPQPGAMAFVPPRPRLANQAVVLDPRTLEAMWQAHNMMEANNAMEAGENPWWEQSFEPPRRQFAARGPPAYSNRPWMRSSLGNRMDRMDGARFQEVNERERPQRPQNDAPKNGNNAKDSPLNRQRSFD